MEINIIKLLILLSLKKKKILPFATWINPEDTAAAAKSLQSCPTLCDPREGSPQGSPPTRPRPWDSLGKNTGVGCHFLLQCMKVKSESCPVLSDSSRPHGLQPTRLLRPWDSPGKTTGVGCHRLLPEDTMLSQINQTQKEKKKTTVQLHIHVESKKADYI